MQSRFSSRSRRTRPPATPSTRLTAANPSSLSIAEPRSRQRSLGPEALRTRWRAASADATSLFTRWVCSSSSSLSSEADGTMLPQSAPAIRVSVFIPFSLFPMRGAR